MKKLFVIVVLLVAFAACKKESDGGSASDPYIRARVDGVSKTFDFDVRVIRLVASGITSYNILAARGPGNAEGLWLQVNAAGDISQTTYTSNAGGNTHAVGFFTPDNSGLYYGAGPEYQQSAPLSITISKIDSAVIEGTFSGTFYYTDTSMNLIDSSKTRVITEGRFLAKMPK